MLTVPVTLPALSLLKNGPLAVFCPAFLPNSSFLSYGAARHFSSLLLLLASPPSRAQPQPVAALPGHWGLEINPTTRDHTVVRFYDGRGQLVYEEALPQLLDSSNVPASAQELITSHLARALQRVLRDPVSARETVSVLSPEFAPSGPRPGYAVR